MAIELRTRQHANPSTRVIGFSHASPISAFIRVPLTWYQSVTVALFPDESPIEIKKVYSGFDDVPTDRHCFCGFCGTALTLWSESPRSEAEYIRVCLGSLDGTDLRDLEDLGLVRFEADEELDEKKATKSEPEVQDAEDVPALTAQLMVVEEEEHKAGQDDDGDDEYYTPTISLHHGLAWLDRLMEGSRLGGSIRLRHSIGTGGVSSTRHIFESSKTTTGGGAVTRVEWEIVEWTAEDDDADTEMGDAAATTTTTVTKSTTETSEADAAEMSTHKRKLADREDVEDEVVA